ncbi:hypothetical protein O6H91_02G046100 [Diphasiastrum complanatum]|uniref:Uncharacterized protein n=3 Tax=Diphasiastrum complanatum TaxID=34168 RepID=A0ACC2EF01_DIPCM|nr:hypothetical protein O6H91_02G046100 [Diphasiastrum complanatum]KAJ7565065.1 hypothetical protein O6H91_02G046100 [Diphasiastrum complanatum]KAJ7565066.1 hypothetical protein O6H91_02G046100 [Diphasiastrum complanatum]
MPRASCADFPGCPPFRAICGDALGFIKVIEAQAEKPVPQVVARWGEPSPGDSITCMSFTGNSSCGLAVARKTGVVDVLDPGNGVVHSRLHTTMMSTNSSCEASLSDKVADNPVVGGLHLFKETSSWSKAVLTCTQTGQVALQSVKLEKELYQLDSEVWEDEKDYLRAKWTVCKSGEVLCSKVDSHERYALFGGRGVELNLWDIENQSKLWDAKSPRRDNLGIYLQTWVTAAVFMSKDDHRKVVVGSGHHQLRLYDVGAQRRPVLTFDFGESPIRALAEDLDGNTVYVGNGSGNLASFDMRIGKMLGGFKGKCAGSIRSISRHPELPLLASCGLDRYLRIHNTVSRQLLALVFLKQQLGSVTFDNNDYSQLSLSMKKGSDQAGDEDGFIEDLEMQEVQDRSKPKRKRLTGKRQSRHDPFLKTSKKN